MGGSRWPLGPNNFSLCLFGPVGEEAVRQTRRASLGSTNPKLNPPPLNLLTRGFSCLVLASRGCWLGLAPKRVTNRCCLLPPFASSVLVSAGRDTPAF